MRTPSDASRARLRLDEKARLASRILWTYLRVRSRIRGVALPALVSELAPFEPVTTMDYGVERLSRAVDRTLRVGSRRPTCLASALVLFHLLRRQGTPAELVIGLPARPADKDAHAWIEIDGVDVGPPPGKSGHVELARYG